MKTLSYLLFCTLVNFGIAQFVIASNSSHNDSLTSDQQKACVVILHGLARTSSAMQAMNKALLKQGYSTALVDYPSRKYKIEQLVSLSVTKGIHNCRQQNAKKIHFVTHSLGGILVRYYLESHSIENLGKVVMLAPPNQGSQVTDNWGNIPGYNLINGPVGQQLGTDKNSIPLSLSAVSFPLGIIAGNKTFNPFLSLSLPNPDDGKVSVENTKVEGMTDHIVLPVTHTFIMRAPISIHQTIHFLKNGQFDDSKKTL